MKVRKVVPNMEFSSVWQNSLLTSNKILLLEGSGVKDIDLWMPLDHRIGEWSCLVELENIPIE